MMETYSVVNLMVDTSELAGDLGVFGQDDAAGAPEAVGDFQDEVLLEEALGFEFLDQRGEEVLVLGGVFVEVGGFQDGVAGAEAVGDGVTAGDGFALGGAGAVPSWATAGSVSAAVRASGERARRNMRTSFRICLS